MLSCAAFLACVLVLAWSGAHAQIVAFGTINVSGWNVAATAAFPAQLQDLLRAAGISVSVVNAGVGGNTTADLLKRVDTDIPQGTKIVILDTIGGIFNDAKKVSAASRAMRTWRQSKPG
jgi:acyl-CoA thioesterase-1